jgi:hypothetical protein
MNLFRLFAHRKNHRSTLLDLHRFGVVQVFRRHSIFRLWEPLREHPISDHDFTS